MVKLLAFLFSSIPALFGAFFAYWTRKYSVAVAGVLAFGTLVVVFIACINAILSQALSFVGVVPFLLAPLGMFIPGNFAACMSAVVSAKICRAAFQLAGKKIDLVVKAS